MIRGERGPEVVNLPRGAVISGHCRTPMDGRGQVFDLHAGCHGWMRIDGERVTCACPCHRDWNQPAPEEATP